MRTTPILFSHRVYLLTCLGHTPRVCKANACSRLMGKFTKIHPRRIQSKSFKRSSNSWPHISAETFFYRDKERVRWRRARGARTMFGLGGSLSFSLLGASRRSSSGSMRIELSFFCSIFPTVWRPDAGGPRMMIFGATRKRIPSDLTVRKGQMNEPSTSFFRNSIICVSGSFGRSTSNDEMHLWREKERYQLRIESIEIFRLFVIFVLARRANNCNWQEEMKGVKSNISRWGKANYLK